jgi:hypothetical protein
MLEDAMHIVIIEHNQILYWSRVGESVVGITYTST